MLVRWYLSAVALVTVMVSVSCAGAWAVTVSPWVPAAWWRLL